MTTEHTGDGFFSFSSLVLTQGAVQEPELASDATASTGSKETNFFD